MGGCLTISFLRILAGWRGMQYDAYLTCLMVLAYTTIGGMERMKNVFEFLGHHSMNIFLFHTFIFAFFFHDFIYASENPILQYLFLLLPCILISMLIEKMKTAIGFYTLTLKIELLMDRILRKNRFDVE